MITPMDLQNKTFSTSPVGYKKSDVDEFLREILIDYEKLYKSSLESNEKIDSLTKLVESYKAIEETMKNTLVTAQTTAEQTVSAANRSSETIVAEATQKSSEIISKANVKVEETYKEFEKIKNDANMFLLRTKAELVAHIKAIDESIKRIEKGC